MSKRDDSDFYYAVEAMTNHERNLWARAGYPRTLEAVKRFLGPNPDYRIAKRAALK